MPSLFYDWFTLLGNLHRYETCWFVTDYISIQTFRTQKYGRFSVVASVIRSWNSTQDLLMRNLNLEIFNAKKYEILPN